MLVNILAEPGLFRDMLKQSLTSSGSEIGYLIDHPDELTELPGLQGFLVAHIQKPIGAFCATIDHLRARQADLPIVLVCAKDVECQLLTRMGSLVNGIISDDRPLELVMNAINVISQGFTIFDPLHAPELETPGEPVARVAAAAPVETLTKREQSILEKLRIGQSNKEIARCFEISDSTVKAHTRSIFRKIGVRNRTQAAVWARENAELINT